MDGATAPYSFSLSLSPRHRLFTLEASRGNRLPYLTKDGLSGRLLGCILPGLPGPTLARVGSKLSFVLRGLELPVPRSPTLRLSGM
jgi:hypothetical protein